MQKFPPPWYQYVPLDFISENFVPGNITDQRTLDYQLRPQLVVPTDQLQARAEQLRRTAHGSAASPLLPPGGIVQPQPGNLPGPIPITSPPHSTVPAGSPGMTTVPSDIGGQAVRPVQP
jgi:hypothetical protein